MDKLLPIYRETQNTESQNFVDPIFSKTLVLVRSRVLKYRPRLNIKEHQLLTLQV